MEGKRNKSMFSGLGLERFFSVPSEEIKSSEVMDAQESVEPCQITKTGPGRYIISEGAYVGNADSYRLKR